MKTILILLLAVTLCAVTKTNAQITYGPVAGANYAKLTNDYELNAERFLLPRFGVMANIQLNDKFSLQPSILYSVKGQKCETYLTFIDEKMYFTYLIFPVNVVYSIKKWNKSDFQIFAGIYSGYCKKACSEDIYGKSDYSLGTSSDDVIRQFDWGYNAGIGYNFSNIQIQAGYSGGAFSCFHNGDYKNSVFTVSLAYFFGKKK